MKFLQPQSFLLGIVLCLFALCSYSQYHTNYSPLKQKKEAQTSELIKLETACNTAVEKAKLKEYKEFLEKRCSNLEADIETDLYLFDTEYYPYVNNILDIIKRENLRYDVEASRMLVGKSAVPNAFCYGNDVLVVNMGLISRLYNEDQLAFVVAHELSHQILKHVDKRMLAIFSYVNSKEYEKKLKEIKKADYNQRARLEALLLKSALKFSKYTRQNEKEADSLAILLLRNTEYKVAEALNTLAILDTIDQEKFKDSILFDQVFNFEEFPFQDKWLKKLDGLDVEEKLDEELLDSLKTHPDCEDRINYLKDDFAIEEEEIVSSVDFNSYSTKADFEIIRYQLQIGRYGLCIKNALLLKKYYPNNSYLTSVIAISFAKIYFAQKEHVLRDYVPRPNDDYDFNYHRILLMIENIRLSELKKVALNYEQKYLNLPKEELVKNEHVFAAFVILQKVKGSEEYEKFKSNYLETFPNGIYKSIIN